MIRFDKAKTESGAPVVAITSTHTDGIEALTLLRQLKAVYPDEWQKVNLEMFKPNMNGINRIQTPDGELK